MLPYNSTLRATIQASTVATLFDSLDHPPASYLGVKHQYRTADGSHHVSALIGLHVAYIPLITPSEFPVP